MSGAMLQNQIDIYYRISIRDFSIKTKTTLPSTKKLIKICTYNNAKKINYMFLTY